MTSRLFKPLAALMLTVSASAVAEEYRPDPARPGAASGDYSQAGGNADSSVPGRSYRDQAPPRYRIEQGSGGSTSAFPRVPGTGYRDYSR